MSMLGMFGLCSPKNGGALLEAMKSDLPAEALVEAVCREFEDSWEGLENGQCSGEVFLALFDHLETAFGVDVRGRAEQDGFGAWWHGSTEDMDAVLFGADVRKKLLALEGAVDGAALSQSVSDFFEADYGDAGQTAWAVLLKNLKAAENGGGLLLWRLC